MPARKNPPEPERLDAHRAARGGAQAASEDAAPAGKAGGESPAEFEQSRAVKRARRIEELRESVDADDYRPDPARIAESMLDNERT